MIIYGKDGNTKELDSVDAREHVATGRWSNEPPEPEPKQAPKVEPKPATKHSSFATEILSK